MSMHTGERTFHSSAGLLCPEVRSQNLKNLADMVLQAQGAGGQFGMDQAAILEQIKNERIVAPGCSGDPLDIIPAGCIKHLGVTVKEQLSEAFHGPVGRTQVVGNVI